MAKAVDWGIIYVLNLAVFTLWTHHDPQPKESEFAIFGLVGAMFMIGYNSFFVERFGATPGKMLVGVKVVTADGNRLTPMRAFARAAAEVCSIGTFYIGYLVAAFDGERRTLHDRMCNTRVVLRQ